MALDLITLPDKPVPALFEDPRVMVIYSLPKTGKTPCAAALPNSIIFDFEGSTDMIAAVKLKIIALKPPPEGETDEAAVARRKLGQYYFSEAILAIRANPGKYKFGIFDTITKLADWCILDATLAYMSSPIGKNFNRYTLADQIATNGKVGEGMLKPRKEWDMVTILPKGLGWSFVWEAYEKWINFIRELIPHVILNGHIKTSAMVNKAGKEVDSKDLDLMGKLKGITTGMMADAIGYMYRAGNKNFISFKPTDEVQCGSRVPHLEGKDILISEKLEDGSLKFYWENIYKGLAK